MAIEWTTLPAWGYGDGARPIDLDSLYRRVYQYYNLISIYTDNFFPGYSGVYRVYNVGSSDRNIVSNGPIDGYDPGSAIGPDLLSEVPYNKILMTIRFPNANARWESRMNVTGDPVNGWLMQISTRWLDDDGNVITVNDMGLNTNPGWTIPFMGAGGAYTAGFPHQFAVTYTINGETCYGFTLAAAEQYSTWSGKYLVWSGEAVCINIKEFAAYLQENNPDMDFGVWEVDAESPEAGPASSTGGYSGYGGDITASDSIAVPSLPSASAAALGFINMYNPTAGGLTGLGEEIFPDFEFTSIVDPTGNDIIDAILNACGAFVEVFNQIPTMFKMLINSRLIDYVQDCHIVPVQPVTGASAHIKLGFRELDISAPTIPNEYVEVDLGSVSLEEFYHQFIDYQPYTRAKLYLPFIGFVPVEPEYWQSGSIGVTYHFNVYDGSFMAYVTSSPSSKVSKMRSSVIGQYAGTAVVHLPLTGLNYSSMVAGLVGGVGGAIAAIGSGNVAAGLSAAINTATSSPQVMSSNGYTASAAFMSCRYPFMIIERSVSHFPANYQHDVGLPSKITTKLGSASGFVSVGDVDLSSVHAKQSEIAEIRSLLASGIYV